jgi:hypothetical protein
MGQANWRVKWRGNSGRMIGIRKPKGVLIQKNGLGLIEGNAVFTLVDPAFPLVPLKNDLDHMDNGHLK